jgi:hypothetical protein
MHGFRPARAAAELLATGRSQGLAGLAVLPDVPTVRSADCPGSRHPGYNSADWGGIFVPKERRSR